MKTIMKIQIYFRLANLFVVLAEKCYALTQVLTKKARYFVDKTKAEVYKQDPLQQLFVDTPQKYEDLPVRRMRKKPHCSYCRSVGHTRPTCPKYREYLRYQRWLRVNQNRTELI